MTPREIVAAAWGITTREPAIRRWAFASSFLETLLTLKLISYQLFFAYKFFILGGDFGFFDVEIMMFHSWPFWAFGTFVGSFIFLLVIEYFVPHVCLGAIIGLSAKAFRKEEMKGGLVLGLFNFLQLFAIHEFLTLSGITTILTVGSLILRYVQGPILFWCLGMLLFIFIFSLFLKFIFSFAQEAVVIEKMSIFHAMGKSFKLIVSHLGRIVFLLILLFVISLRILLNVAMLIVVPGIVIGIGVLLALFLPDVVSYSIASVLGFAIVLAASYLFGYLLAFNQTVWTITYLELIQKKDLDVIL